MQQKPMCMQRVLCTRKEKHAGNSGYIPRDVCISKETYTHEKKTPIHMGKTVQQKPMCMQRDLYT